MYIAEEYSGVDMENVGKGVVAGTAALAATAGLVNAIKKNKQPKTIIKEPAHIKKDNTMKYLAIAGVGLLAITLTIVLIKSNKRNGK